MPPSSWTDVCSPSMRAVRRAHALALPDWVDQRMRQDENDDGDSDIWNIYKVLVGCGTLCGMFLFDPALVTVVRKLEL